MNSEQDPDPDAEPDAAPRDRSLKAAGDPSANRVTVTVEDHTRNKQRRARIAADAPVRDLLPALITALELPMTDRVGCEVRYHLTSNGQPLDDELTLADAGVGEHAVLALVARRLAEQDPFEEQDRERSPAFKFGEQRIIANRSPLDDLHRLEQLAYKILNDVNLLKLGGGGTGGSGGGGGGSGGNGGGGGGGGRHEPPSITFTIAIDARGQRQLAVEGALNFHAQDTFRIRWEVEGWIDWTNRTAEHLANLPHRTDGANGLWSDIRARGEQFHRDVFNDDHVIMHHFGLARGLVSPGYEDRLVLRFAGPRWYVGAPFELLRDPEQGLLATRVSLVRRVDGIPRGGTWFNGIFAREDGRPITALFIASASQEWAAEEATRAQEALLEGAARAGHRIIPVMLGPDEATMEKMRNAIERCDAELVHIVSGAEFNAEDPGESGLLFPVRSGDSDFQRLMAREIKHRFDGSKTRLLFFSAPGSAATGTREQLSHVESLGLLDAAVQAGIPSAIGYRWTVTDASITLAKEFYRTLGETGSVPRAARRARYEVSFMPGQDPTWAGLVVICQ